MNPFVIGHHQQTGTPVTITHREFCNHAHVQGQTGMGKSQLGNALGEYFLEQRYANVVFDPHGAMVHHLVAFATRRRLTNRLIVIDANAAADQHVFPLNFLAVHTTDPAMHASQMMKAIAKCFGEQDSDTKPRLERQTRSLLIALIESGLNITEMIAFLNLSDGSFRHRALERVKNPYVRQHWQEFDAMAKRSDKEMLIESVLNRAAKILLNDPIRRVLGAPTFNLDWEEIRRKRVSVYVNLQPVRVSKECQQLIGTLLLDSITNHALQSTRRENPLLVLADELDEIASPDFGTILQALRKRSVFVWCFLQFLEQLRSRDVTNRLYASIMANCATKIAFRSSYDDARLLAREMFPGEFVGTNVKDELHRTLLLPKESTRRIVGRAESRSETFSESEGTADYDGIGYGDVDTQGFAVSDGMSVQGIYGAPLQSSHMDASSGASTSTSSRTSGSSSSRSSSYAQSHGTSKSETVVPFYEYERTSELAGRTFFSVEEEAEKHIATLQMQACRHAICKIGDRPSVPIITGYVQPQRVRPQDIQQTLDRLAKRDMLPVAEVDRLIENRQSIHALPDRRETMPDNAQPLESVFRPVRRKA